MDNPQRQFWRDQLRFARATAQADGEGFFAVLHALELIGQQQTGKIQGFKSYKKGLSALAQNSPLAACVASKWPSVHAPFVALYDELRRARNDAVHQGSFARFLTGHVTELANMLEDGIMSDASNVVQFMVRDVVEAKPWHPISYVRQQMLTYAFSYLPVFWKQIGH